MAFSLWYQYRHCSQSNGSIWLFLRCITELWLSYLYLVDTFVCDNFLAHVSDTLDTLADSVDEVLGFGQVQT
jgi:hypothetical protein